MLYGFAGGLLSVIVLLAYGGLTNYYQADSTGFGVVLTILLLVHLALAVPMILLGYYITQYQEWARSLMIFVLALNILNLPFGSLLGIYGLWVLLTPETEPLFLDPPRRRRKPPVSSTTAEQDRKIKADLRSEPRS
jgi:hypothetical protein